MILLMLGVGWYVRSAEPEKQVQKIFNQTMALIEKRAEWDEEMKEKVEKVAAGLNEKQRVKFERRAQTFMKTWERERAELGRQLLMLGEKQQIREWSREEIRQAKKFIGKIKEFFKKEQKEFKMLVREFETEQQRAAQ